MREDGTRDLPGARWTSTGDSTGDATGGRSGGPVTAALVTLAVIVVVGAVVLVVGLRRRGRSGGGTADTAPTPAARALPADLSPDEGRLVLLQFSSAFCTSCRDTRGVLGDVAADLPGLVHRDVDLAARPELVRLLGVHRTPTTLLVDGRGRELLRVSGVPRRAALVTAIEPHLGGAGD